MTARKIKVVEASQPSVTEENWTAQSGGTFLRIDEIPTQDYGHARRGPDAVYDYSSEPAPES